MNRKEKAKKVYSILNQAYKLNDRHLESLVELYEISLIQTDTKESQRKLELIKVINPERANYLLKKS